MAESLLTIVVGAYVSYTPSVRNTTKSAATACAIDASSEEALQKSVFPDSLLPARLRDQLAAADPSSESFRPDHEDGQWSVGDLESRVIVGRVLFVNNQLKIPEATVAVWTMDGIVAPAPRPSVCFPVTRLVKLTPAQFRKVAGRLVMNARHNESMRNADAARNAAPESLSKHTSRLVESILAKTSQAGTGGRGGAQRAGTLDLGSLLAIREQLRSIVQAGLVARSYMNSSISASAVYNDPVAAALAYVRDDDGLLSYSGERKSRPPPLPMQWELDASTTAASAAASAAHALCNEPPRSLEHAKAQAAALEAATLAVESTADAIAASASPSAVFASRAVALRTVAVLHPKSHRRILAGPPLVSDRKSVV